MLQLAEVHALASMLAEDEWKFDLDVIEDLVGEAEMESGTCKSVLMLDGWVIKYTSPYARSSSESEVEHLEWLASERPSLLQHFVETHRISQDVIVQERLTPVSQDEYEDELYDEVNDVTYEASVCDVFYRNVGRRNDGTWAIFDFDSKRY